LLDEKSSEIEIPSLHCLIIGCKDLLTCWYGELRYSAVATVMFTAVYVGIWSFHGTYSTGNTGSIRLYTARQHTAVIRGIRNGCSTARLRSYCNVHERSSHSERLDTVVYDRRNARPGKGWVLDFHLRPILNFIKDEGERMGIGFSSMSNP
jgi:hypothetical protein